MLYTDLAARTKNIRFSPLGLVLPSWDPIRCAEEIAVLDHLTKGRIYAGFARGYQDRWVNVLGQQYHARLGDRQPQPSRLRGDTQGHQDGLDRRILQLRRRYYKVPYPYNDGIRRWPVAEGTREYGAPGEIDDKGVVRRISVVPKPYQQPHPKLFQPFSVVRIRSATQHSRIYRAVDPMGVYPQP